MAACLDCGLDYYRDFPLDVLLPRAQWLLIHPADHGVPLRDECPDDFQMDSGVPVFDYGSQLNPDPSCLARSVLREAGVAEDNC